MKKFLRILKLVAVNALVVIILIILIDVCLTKFHMIPLKARKSGSSIYGYSEQPVILKDSTKKDSVTIVVVGDSHLEYYDTMRSWHQSQVFFDYLKAHNIPARIITLGTARTSPIQDMFIYDEMIKKKGIKPDFIIFQIYAGNDFSEIIRSDDRPRVDFRPDGTPDTVPIHWVLERPADKTDKDFTSWPADSRLLYVTNSVVKRGNILLKVMAAQRANELLHFSFSDRIEYMKNLNRFNDSRLGYPGAVASQFLNQYYLMEKYPKPFIEESKVRMKYFFEYFKKSNPDAVCMFMYCPSAPAIDAMNPEDEKIYKDILKKSHLSDIDIPKKEHQLYVMCDSLNTTLGKPFQMYDMSDTLRIASKMDGTQTFYDKATIHVDRKARKVIGDYWGKIIVQQLENRKKQHI